MSTTVSALVEVRAAGADDEELAEATRRLRAELLELDVTGAEPAPAPDRAGPDGAKGGGVMAVAGLLVQFAGQDVLAAVISAIQGWLGRQRSRSVKLTIDGDSIELTGATSAEQTRLIELWAARHAGAS
jgi:Effector Associated Constant Component 1